MSLKIIVAEKADAGRRIAYFLSEGKQKTKRSGGLNYIEFETDSDKFMVIPLSGHIVEMDFPKELNDWSKVDLKKLIFADVKKNLKNRTAGKTLKDIGKGSDEFIVATDYDREGELIGVEALEIAGISRNSGPIRISRAKFSALTKHEITDAFDNRIDVDYDLADSAAAREEIDLRWGAVLTRYFSVSTKRLGKNFLSVGRVQTPTLALLVEREKEIQSFVQEPFWRVVVVFNKKGKFRGVYEKGDIFDQKEAEKILEAVNGKNGETLEFQKEEKRIPKPPPFNTTEFLREASRIGIVPARAMSIAESLYVKGYISYPRTDNTVYQPSIGLKSVLSKLEKGEFSEEVKKVLDQEVILPSRGKTETKDHPPIYPVSAVKPGTLKGDYHKVYELVVRRFLATLYRHGMREARKAVIKVDGYNFVTEGSKIIDPGWLALYPYRKVQESYHPDLEKGEEVKAAEWDMEEDVTKPPPRFNYASLLRQMEDLKLGTKSTRPDIIDKLQRRGFIEGGIIRPTYLGMGFVEALTTINSPITKPEMTATLEDDMDKIAGKETSRQEVVNVSKDMLVSVLDGFRENQEHIVEVITKALHQGDVLGKCPIHSTDLVLLKARFAAKIKCSTPGCKIDYYAPDRALIKLEDKKCPECSLPLIRVVRKGQAPEIRCMDPKCKHNTEIASVGKCPDDGGTLLVRQSRNGKRFLGCANYPKCTRTYPLPQMGFISPSGETCPKCGAPILIATRKGFKWKFCPKMDCAYNEKKNGSGKKKTSDSGT